MMSAVTATETGTETSRARIEDIQVQVIAKARNINCRIGSTIIQGTISLGLSLLKRKKQIGQIEGFSVLVKRFTIL